MVLTLYEHPEGWGLPSMSAASIYAEAYLRLAGVQFSRVNCTTPSQSPTGQLPAAEQDAAICDASDGRGEFGAARATIAFFKKHVHELDDHLSVAQKAEMLAFSSLVESKLEVATEYTCWCDPTGFAELKKAAYSGKLPFPLSYFIPLSQQREVKQKYAHTTAEKVYQGAVFKEPFRPDQACLIGLRLSIKATFLCRFTAILRLDALLAAHLLFYRSSPAVAPILKDKVTSLSPLCRYTDHLTSTFFSSTASVPPQKSAKQAAEETASWSDAAKAAEETASWPDAAKGEKAQTKTEPTAQEKEMLRYGRMWLFGAGTAIAAYVLLCGNYVQSTCELVDSFETASVAGAYAGS
eukprot:gene28886-32078_t